MKFYGLKLWLHGVSLEVVQKDLEVRSDPWLHCCARTDRCLKRVALMAFISLSNLAAKTGRVVQSQHVTATQTKKSTGAVELGFRLSKSAMDETGIAIGDRVDILYDKDENQWMIKKISEGGFGVSGQKNKHGGYSSCAVRLTLRPGFPRLSEDEDENKKLLSDDSITQLSEGVIIFRLGDE